MIEGFQSLIGTGKNSWSDSDGRSRHQTAKPVEKQGDKITGEQVAQSRRQKGETLEQQPLVLEGDADPQGLTSLQRRNGQVGEENDERSDEDLLLLE